MRVHIFSFPFFLSTQCYFAIADYVYHTLAAKASGELCLKYLFSFGALPRSPLLDRFVDHRPFILIIELTFHFFISISKYNVSNWKVVISFFFYQQLVKQCYSDSR